MSGNKKIKVRDIPDVEAKLLEAVQIMHYMRKWQKLWHHHYGYANKVKRQEWEDRADEFLASLVLVPGDGIIIEEPTTNQDVPLQNL